MARRRRRRSGGFSRARRARRARRNPAGGWLPAIGGFLAVPIATHMAVAASSRVVPVADTRSLMNRTQIADVGTAVLAWAGRDRIKDPGWRSFVTGGMYASIIAAVFRPVAYAMIAARGEVQQGPALPVVYGPSAPAYVPPSQVPGVRPQLAEADEGYDVIDLDKEVTPAAPAIVVEEDDDFSVQDVFDILPGFGF